MLILLVLFNIFASVYFTGVLCWQTEQSLIINYLLFIQIVQKEEEKKAEEVKVSAQKVWWSLTNLKLKMCPNVVQVQCDTTW